MKKDLLIEYEHNLIFGKGRDKFSREPSGNQASTHIFGFVFISQCGVLFGSPCPENRAEVEKTTKKVYESNERLYIYITIESL